MIRGMGPIAALFALAASCAASAQVIPPEDLTDEHVTLAIRAIVDELYQRKHDERFWEPGSLPSGQSEQEGGYTALVVLALVRAGESYQDPRLRDAVSYLEEVSIDGVYALCVRTMLWASLPPRFAPNLEADARRLLAGFSPTARGWDYRMNPATTRQDNSIRQFGALALWEAAARGVKVDDRYWRTLEEGFLRLQLSDGGWNYTGAGRATGSMTAAGLASVFITQDQLHAGAAASLAARPVMPHERAMTSGLAWMDKNFSPTENPGRNQYFYYYLYGVERVALASGYKYFAGQDWYRTGAAELIRRLCKWDAADGTMTVHARMGGESRRAAVRTDDLAFALLFLSRGRAPIAINKLQDDAVRWNNRPRDVANLTAWMSDEAAQQLNWQIVSSASPVEEWLDAPLLWFASNDAPHEKWGLNNRAPARAGRAAHREARERLEQQLKGEEPIALDRIEHKKLATLKRYLDLGGLLFAVSEGAAASARPFAAAVEQAGQLLYPEYTWRDVPQDHWAYTAHTPVRFRPRLRSLSNGVRDLIILAPGDDLPATFQTRNLDRNGLSHHHTAANIYFYASEMNRTPPRLATFSPAPAPASTTLPESNEHSLLRVVRGAYAGNWNPEPLALEQWQRWLHDAHPEQRVQFELFPLAAISAISPRPHLVIVSGVDRHDFTNQEAASIKRYVEQGGTVLFETAGGLGAFTQAAEEQMAAAFSASAELLLRHHIITGEELEGAASLERVEYRPYTLNVIGSLDTAPRLRGILVDGRAALLFSRDDLSHAWLAQPRWGVNGYSTSAARSLLRNILLAATAEKHEAP